MASSSSSVAPNKDIRNIARHEKESPHGPRSRDSALTALPNQSGSTIDVSNQAEDGKLRHRLQSQDDPMATLLSHSAPEALHNSQMLLSLHAAIHPGTRQGAINQLYGWITAPKLSHSQSTSISSGVGSTPIHWLSGSPGSGKTSIQLHLAKRCLQDNRLLASFFFSMNSVGSSELHKNFVPTIAYQLASTVPGLQSFVSTAIQNDPDVFSKPPGEQMMSLVFKPLEECFKRSTGWSYWRRRFKASLFHRQRSPAVSDSDLQASRLLEESTAFRKLHSEWWNRNIIVVDALDECIGPREQQVIARFIFWASRHSPKFPLRFIISAPTQHQIIRNLFNECRVGMLSDTRLDTRVADADIRVYLEVELARIRQSRPEIVWPEGWPSLNTVNRLVAKGRNLFIYVSIIIRFINNATGNPIELLDLLLSSLPDQTQSTNGGAHCNQFAELDALYTFILHYRQPRDLPNNIPRDGVVDLRKQLLHAVMFSGKDFKSPFELDEHLSLPSGSADVALRDLHPIIFISPLSSPSNSSTSPGAEGKIWFRHKSMWDFLVTKERSGDLHQSLPEERMTRIQKLEAAAGMENIPNSRFWALTKPPQEEEGGRE